jgi:phosphate transport system permease protein
VKSASGGADRVIGLGMIRSVVLPFDRGGMIDDTMLGLGRAMSETIAVLVIVTPVFQI